MSGPIKSSSLLPMWTDETPCPWLCQPRQVPQERATNTNYACEQNVPRTFSINNVSSYSSLCHIYSTPVTYLIDTEAGVSLLNKEVWDKVKSSEVELSPVTAHRLVGVDGIPIKVQGAVSLPVTIAEISAGQYIMILPILRY